MTLIQALVAGILIGGLYGLFSSGLSLIFGVTKVVNFAHGDFVTLGMYGAIIAMSVFSLDPLFSLIPVALIMFALGSVLYWLVIRRTLTQKTVRPDDAHHSQMIITLSLSILIQNTLMVVFSPASRSVNSLLEGTWNLGGIYVNKAQFVSFLIAVLCFGLLYYLVTYTSIGKSVTATVDDSSMATMVGINTNKIYSICFSIGIALAANAGVILVTYYPATPVTGSTFIIIAFVTVVLGGLGNIVGAFLAGLILGVVQQLTATYVAIDLQNLGIFVVFILILLLRPQGLFGKKVVS
jgi:branched-chain amino acid transport system permease protein